MAQNSAPAPVAPAQAATSNGPGLDEIVVTAQRRSERLQDVPLTISEVSRNDLAKGGVTTLKDLQNIVSGFTFGGQGSVAQPSIRGVSTLLSAAGSENPNALYVDGIYMATQAVLGVELPDVDRVEILKGPQGTLFGRNATGGAIEVFTRNPSFTPAASINIEPSYYTGSGGSHDSARINARAFVSMPIIDNLLAASISGGYSYTQGYQVNDATKSSDGENIKSNIRGKLLITPADNLKITLSGFNIDDSGDGELLQTPWHGLSAASVYPGSVVSTKPWHTAYDTGAPQMQNAILKQHGFASRIEAVFDIGTFTSLTGYTKTFTNNPATSIHGAQGTLPCLLNFACLDFSFAIKNREISQEFNFSSNKIGILSFIGGLYYYNAKGSTLGQIQKTLAAISPYFPLTVQNTNFETTAYAAYGEATIKPTEALSLVLGLRQSHEPHKDSSIVPYSGVISKTFNSTTPRASIRYEVTPRFNVYGTFSIGYKSGLTGATNIASNPPFAFVAPEKLYAYEVGMKYASHNISANLSGFYYNYKDKQEQTFLGTSTVIKNTGPVLIYGLDFDARARISAAWNVSGTLSYIPVAKYRNFPDASGQSTVRIPFNPAFPPFNCSPGGACGGFYPGAMNMVSPTFDASGERLTRTPKVSASATVSYASGPFDASATVSYSSKIYEDLSHEIYQSSYATLTAQLGYKIDERFRVGVFGRNLTNKAYISNALTSSAGFSVGYAPPREIGMSFGFNY